MDNKIRDQHISEFFDDADLFHNTMPFTVIIFIIVAILGLSRLIVWLFSNHQIVLNLHNKLKSKIFWNTPLRLFLEEYLVLAITTLLKTKTLAFTGYYQSFVSLFAMIAGFALICAIPAAIFFVVYKNYKIVKTEAFQSKYGTLTSDLNLDNKLALLYYVVFMLRRIFLALIIVFM